MEIHFSASALAVMAAVTLLILAAWSPLSLRLTLTVRDLRASARAEVTAFWGIYRFTVSRGDGRGGLDLGENGARRGAARREPSFAAGPFAPGRIRRSEYLTTLRCILSKSACNRLSFRLALGTGDAASTGIGAGIAWGVAGAVVSVVRRLVGRWHCVPAVSVIPLFNRAGLEAHLDCILVIRVGHAICAALGLLFGALRRSSLRGRAPHPGPDEDGDGEYQGHGGRKHGRG